MVRYLRKAMRFVYELLAYLCIFLIILGIIVRIYDLPLLSLVSGGGGFGVGFGIGNSL
jgi:hypothetical protein